MSLDPGHRDTVSTNEAFPKESGGQIELLEEASSLRRLRRFDEAGQLLRAAIDRRPNNPQLYIKLGWIAGQQGLFEEALAAFDQALTLDPNDEDAVTGKSEALGELRRFDEAEQLLHAAIDRRPNNPALHTGLGWIAGQQDHFEEALAAFDQALAIDGGYENALLGKARALRSLNRHDRALEVLRRALDLHPKSLRLRTELAQDLYAQGRYEETIAVVNQLLADKPKDKAAKKLRRVSLWRSAYLPPVRSLRRRVDRGVARGLSRWNLSLRVLNALQSVDCRVYEHTLAVVGQYRRKAGQARAWRAAIRLGWTVAVFIIVALMSLTLPLAVSRSIELNFTGPQWILALILHSILTILAFSSLLSVFRSSVNKEGRVATILSGVIVAIVIVTLVVSQRDLSNPLVLAVVTGLTTGVLGFWLVAVLIYIPDAGLEWHKRFLNSSLPRGAILSQLIDILYDLHYKPNAWDPDWRKRCIRNLEELADTIERDLSRDIETHDIRTREWWNNRTAGMAAAVRDLKKWILTPHPDTGEFLEVYLRQQLIFIAAGELERSSVAGSRSNRFS